CRGGQVFGLFVGEQESLTVFDFCAGGLGRDEGCAVEAEGLEREGSGVGLEGVANRIDARAGGEIFAAYVDVEPDFTGIEDGGRDGAAGAGGVADLDGVETVGAGLNGCLVDVSIAEVVAEGGGIPEGKLCGCGCCNGDAVAV